MRKIIASLLLFSTLSFAAGGCLLTQQKSLEVTWKAYKTLAKAGVTGKFTSVEYTPASLEGKNFKELFLGSKVKIDKSKISTGNEGRDETLVKMFFDKLKGNYIEAEIVEIKATDKHEKGKPRKGIVKVKITMNSKSVTIPMRYIYNKGDFSAKGVIDLFDFSAFKALASINKACFDLHEGKTWNDVEIGFHTKIVPTLCER
ncbi:MAG: YceI family protein [Hydrogenimonas sp.]|nr:YceI family protein [Hydrogenimonas sp.]